MFAAVLDGSSFAEMVKSRRIDSFIVDQLKEVAKADSIDPQPTIIVLGSHGVKDKVVRFLTKTGVWGYKKRVFGL